MQHHITVKMLVNLLDAVPDLWPTISEEHWDTLALALMRLPRKEGQRVSGAQDALETA